MNIFITDPEPIKCAQMLDDLRLNKMILETAQMLSVAHHMMSSNPSPLLYKKTHQNHPCSIWIRSSKLNYRWAYELLRELVLERFHRTGKWHATWDKLAKILDEVPDGIINEPLLPFPNCSPHKDMPVFSAYRLTMLEKWNSDKKQPTWGIRKQPVWR